MKERARYKGTVAQTDRQKTQCMHPISVYVRLCVSCMCALYVCIYMCALYVCLICVHLHVCPVCVPYMCALNVCIAYPSKRCTAKKKKGKSPATSLRQFVWCCFFGGGECFLTQLLMRRLEFLAGVKMAGNIFKIAVERLL